MHFAETSVHRFVVGNALEIGTTHYAYEFVRHLYSTFFCDLIVAYDTERDVGSYSRELVELFVGKEAVCYLDYTFATHVGTLEVVTNCDSRLALAEVKHIDDVKKAFVWDMIYDCAVLNSGHKKFLVFHL